MTMKPDQERLDRIEKVVIALEGDMRVMTSAVTDMAESVKSLVALQQEQALMKQEMEYRCEATHKELEQGKRDRINIWRELHKDRERHTELKLEVSKKASVDDLNDLAKGQWTNTFVTGGVAKFAWLFIAGMIATAWYLVRR